jgi:hypothetical protein
MRPSPVSRGQVVDQKDKSGAVYDPDATVFGGNSYRARTRICMYRIILGG